MNPQAIIISGGSRGLGLVLVEHCLAHGCAVATFARSATAEMDRLGEQFPDRFMFSAVDSANSAAVDTFVDAAYQKWGHIYGLVNNAAIGQDHLLANMPVEMVGQIIGVNLQAPDPADSGRCAPHVARKRRKDREYHVNLRAARVCRFNSVLGH